MTELNADVNLVSFSGDINNKTLVITVTGNTRLDIDEYVISIYEAYGISEFVTGDQRWIISAPEIRVMSELILEVTLYHA
jgi:hypothetical protein